ncbi:hypothetical protein E2C01_037514 [Portunus trituberculatus]|uniref:Uncharacterized protein n=1 Tax=Portunus trituberculatus TaxID=210409 RepID=A0A5B7FBM2_PORTR|nr:hypothetical protein [Portunus trituberculatus]
MQNIVVFLKTAAGLGMCTGIHITGIRMGQWWQRGGRGQSFVYNYVCSL